MKPRGLSCGDLQRSSTAPLSTAKVGSCQTECRRSEALSSSTTASWPSMWTAEASSVAQCPATEATRSSPVRTSMETCLGLLQLLLGSNGDRRQHLGGSPFLPQCRPGRLPAAGGLSLCSRQQLLRGAHGRLPRRLRGVTATETTIGAGSSGCSETRAFLPQPRISRMPLPSQGPILQQRSSSIPCQTPCQHPAKADAFSADQGELRGLPLREPCAGSSGKRSRDSPSLFSCSS